MIKPSEMTPMTSIATKAFVEKYLDTDAIVCINGGMELAKVMND